MASSCKDCDELEGAPAYSIVSTMYRSRGFLPQFLADCKAAMAQLGCTDYEIVLVNDGSPDDSLAYALEQRATVAELVVVDLSRNFGHHAAMQAGLRASRGELVFLIDSDLEVSPLVLPEFHAKLKESRVDMVFGYQEVRKGGWVEAWTGGLFYKGFNLLSDIKIPENIATERVMTRRFVRALLQMGDRNLFLGGMLTWTGFEQIGIPLSKTLRKGPSTYTFARRLGLMVNAVSSFSSRPLLLLFNAGVTITVLSLGYIAYLVVRKLVFDDALLGFTSLMAFTALSLGISTTGLGVIGVYLGKVFNQVQNRPNYIVRAIHRREES
ncbi:MAG TPA: glycosyltransferase family 2 protein [Burkholderiaceae bacterium]